MKLIQDPVNSNIFWNESRRCIFVTFGVDMRPREMVFIVYTTFRKVLFCENYVIGGETSGLYR